MKKKITNFAIDPDESTLSQFDHCCEQDFVVAASLMPDAHSGYVAPIGSVLLSEGYVVPAWVGYDIGCGMIAMRFVGEDLLEKVKKNSSVIYKLVKKTIPMGTGGVNHIQDISEKTKEEFKVLLHKFKEGSYNDEVYKFLKNKALSHLGSLGSGNHFIELGEADDELWLVIHSGSRGVGHKVAQYYMKQSAGKERGFEATHPLEVDSQLGKEYLNILGFGLDFALLNRLEMAYKVRDILREVFEMPGLDFELWVNKNHNHAILENGKYIHRKGATPAKRGEKGVIPANMRDGCFLVEGLGNKDFLESSSHGAGRVLSRTEARKVIGMDEFKLSMKGIVGTVSKATLDEAPQAYKNIYDVMEAQKQSVKIVRQIRPIINWKGE